MRGTEERVTEVVGNRTRRDRKRWMRTERRVTEVDGMEGKQGG